MFCKFFSIHIFVDSSDKPTPVFLIQAYLMIPKVVIQPNLEEVQEVLNNAGRNITSVAKGVGQWTSGKPQVSGLALA